MTPGSSAQREHELVGCLGHVPAGVTHARASHVALELVGKRYQRAACQQGALALKLRPKLLHGGLGLARLGPVACDERIDERIG